MKIRRRRQLAPSAWVMRLGLGCSGQGSTPIRADLCLKKTYLQPWRFLDWWLKKSTCDREDAAEAAVGPHHEGLEAPKLRRACRETTGYEAARDQRPLNRLQATPLDRNWAYFFVCIEKVTTLPGYPGTFGTPYRGTSLIENVPPVGPP